MQHMPVTANDDRVTCVMAALISGNADEPLRENVYDLAFPLVAPLKTDNCKILFHSNV